MREPQRTLLVLAAVFLLGALISAAVGAESAFSGVGRVFMAGAVVGAVLVALGRTRAHD